MISSAHSVWSRTWLIWWINDLWPTHQRYRYCQSGVYHFILSKTRVETTLWTMVYLTWAHLSSSLLACRERDYLKHLLVVSSLYLRKPIFYCFYPSLHFLLENSSFSYPFLQIFIKEVDQSARLILWVMWLFMYVAALKLLRNRFHVQILQLVSMVVLI